MNLAMGGGKHSFLLFLDLHERIGEGVLAIVFLLDNHWRFHLSTFNTPGMDFLAALFSYTLQGI